MATLTLVLDIGYQPHIVVDWRRAVSLLFHRKAELVESYDEPLLTEAQAARAGENGWTFALKVPAVIRLLDKVRRKKTVRFSRINVLTRDRWTCQYCGAKLPTRKLNYDHVIPRSQGGKTTWENIVTSCLPCNGKKAGRTPEQAGMKLSKKPVKPRSLPIVSFHFDPTRSIPEAWRNWVYWHGGLIEDS